MLEPSHNAELPEIPAKRYFTIGEVSELCEVKPHVLRYWEQEFSQLKPVKRRGNRRYYQRQDVVLIRQIRTLLYEQGFTIGGARQRMAGGTSLQIEDVPEKLTIVPLRAAPNVQLIRELIEEVEEAISHLA
jgi:DNA-binding transcriptional MerR regulator